MLKGTHATYTRFTPIPAMLCDCNPNRYGAHVSQARSLIDHRGTDVLLSLELMDTYIAMHGLYNPAMYVAWDLTTGHGLSDQQLCWSVVHLVLYTCCCSQLLLFSA